MKRKIENYATDSERPVRPLDSKTGIDVFPNPERSREYWIEIVQPEFTSVCPKTGHPDFGTLTIRYSPDAYCLELKALKIYLQGFRNKGIFYETLVNELLDDLVRACRPRRMTLVGEFKARGGITTTITAEHSARAGRRR
ncbi:MAG: preQ(1) synthase [Planctomycetota bacterium]